MSSTNQQSPFHELPGIEYFDFEEDFVEKNIRCIPMIVRFKMDAVGIKLKLSEWSLFSKEERVELAVKPFNNEEADGYHKYLTSLVNKYTGDAATLLAIKKNPEWSELNMVPLVLQEKAREFGWEISVGQWIDLTDLQRFALLKLCGEGHENKNFPKAMREFDLINKNITG